MAKRIIPIVRAPGKVHLTPQGFNELKLELKEHKENKRSQAVERVARARDFGDLTENSEYHQARDELAFIDGRIEELEELISKVAIIDGKKKRTTVDLGCKVTIHGNGKSHTYTIVGEWEADPKEKKISHQSPLGKALVGKKKGDEVEIEAPAGKVLYMIQKIH
ncbi:transcription elongation factor GreA [Patescibacteria group bacterium]|nr:transcription elongation factor GreA [Patescibacteria group bacterium]